MTKLRAFAKGQECTLRLPGICNHDPETVVLAHLPCVDKGMGYKSPDWWAVHACSGCHDVIDARVRLPNVPYSEVRKWSLSALYETQKRLIKAGLMKV